MKAIKPLLLSCLVFIISLNLGTAQSSHKPEKVKDPKPIGWGVNLGNISFYNHSFQFGLAPNLAYKLSESLAVGVMMKVDYFFQKFPIEQVKFSAFDLGPTVFTRFKPLWSWDNATPFLKGIFLQAEYERGFLTRYGADQNGNLIINNGKLEHFKINENFIYVGVGAASGYPFSTFVSIQYNVLDDFNSARDPFNYRIGFTYNY